MLDPCGGHVRNSLTLLSVNPIAVNLSLPPETGREQIISVRCYFPYHSRGVHRESVRQLSVGLRISVAVTAPPLPIISRAKRTVGLDLCLTILGLPMEHNSSPPNDRTDKTISPLNDSCPHRLLETRPCFRKREGRA